MFFETAIARSQHIARRFAASTSIGASSAWPAANKSRKFSTSSSAASPPEAGSRTSQFMILINNEDYRAETAVLNKLSESAPSPGGFAQETDPKLNALTVVGGADTSLVTLMHPNVASVTGLDMSPNALHLLRLKLAVAVSSLTTPEAKAFLVDGRNGRAVLREQLLPHLPEDSAEFFMQEELDLDIEHGIFRKANDNPFNACLREMLETNHGLHLSRFDTMSLAEKEEVFRVIEAPESAGVMYQLLEPMFQAAPWFARLPQPMQDHLLTKIDMICTVNLKGAYHVLRDADKGLIPMNEYYTNVLRYGQPFCEPNDTMALPPWLTDVGRATLKAKQGALRTVCGKLEDLDEFDGAPFDVMTLSNCYDFTTEDVATESIKVLADKALKDGGSILIRRATGQASEILADAGGKFDVVNDLHMHDLAILFYRHPGSIACSSFHK
mmetsp:Transcript_477/g.1061  ORF Transcript_477/g.1061 Transcript_477/m.1061 type:complete len:441 (+) Transcript_477:92-1414(+)